MNNKKKFIFLLVFLLVSHCSFDKKSGIWSGENEVKRISELEKNQNIEDNSSFVKIYSSEDTFNKEIALVKNINITNPKEILSWPMSNLNYQNDLGNIYLPGINNTFLKTKIGKNKFSTIKVISSPLIHEGNIIFSDNNGTIFNVSLDGKINWKKNIYQKVYQKIYKSLVFSIYQNNLYVADNIGFVYSMNLENGKIAWIKNHSIPLKSHIKVYEKKIFLVNQDNRIICLSTKDGTKIWDVRTISSFIKLQNFLSSAISKEGDLLVINSAGDLLKLKASNGRMFWSFNTLESPMLHDADFFKSSNIVISDDNIILSVKSLIFSYDLNTGYNNWKQDVATIGTPIIDGSNIYIVTDNGFFVIIDKNNGKIISSKNILKILKKNKRDTSITGFIMGSGKVYSTTANGHMIVASAATGNVEFFKKIGDPLASSPIINDGKLYILSKNSRIYGFN